MSLIVTQNSIRADGKGETDSVPPSSPNRHGMLWKDILGFPLFGNVLEEVLKEYWMTKFGRRQFTVSVLLLHSHQHLGELSHGLSARSKS